MAVAGKANLLLCGFVHKGVTCRPGALPTCSYIDFIHNRMIKWSAILSSLGTPEVHHVVACCTVQAHISVLIALNFTCLIILPIPNILKIVT